MKSDRPVGTTFTASAIPGLLLCGDEQASGTIEEGQNNKFENPLHLAGRSIMEIELYREDGRGETTAMNAEISHVGRCMTTHEGKPCNRQAAYVQIWSASRVFRYCEEHVPPLVKKTAEANKSR